MTSMRSSLARVRGLGSAKEGVEHWYVQRLTALANLLLLGWFALSLIAHAGAGHAEIVAWMQSPVVAAILCLVVVNMFYHASLGLQVVAEDYVAPKGARLAVIIGVKFFAVFLAAVGVLSVLRIAFG